MNRQTSLELSIRKGSDVPVFRQIVEQITLLVKNGELQPGDRLPPERELARQLHSARGTIAKAYARLAANQIVVIAQGRGTTISENQDIAGNSRKDIAVEKIRKLIIDLEQQRFTHQEISTLLHLLLMEREEQRQRFSLAAIDCNPEALSVFEHQLQHLSKVQVIKFLLKELMESSTAARQLAQYDLILCTSTHYSELLSRFPRLKDRLIQAAVAPSQQTVIDLSAIPVTARIGIVTRSLEFQKIILRHVRDFKIPMAGIECMLEADAPDLDALLAGRQILVIPPDSPLLDDRDQLAALGRFRSRAGKVIPFTYQIERGTLIHIEQRIADAMEAH